MKNLKQLALFCHKMENALHAGFDIERALGVMSDENSGSLKAAIKRTLDGVKAGRQFSSAMRTDEQIYTPELVNAVYITEQTGHYEYAFRRMAKRFDAQYSTRQKIQRVALYPIIVLIIFILAVFAVAAFYHHLLAALCITGVILGAIAVFFFLKYAGSELARNDMIVGNVLIRMPLVGRMILQSELADLADDMAVFYSCGVSVEQGLRYSVRSIKYKALRDKVLKAADWVGRGNPLSEALQMQDIFSADLISSIRIGEASGNVDGMLEKIAEYYRQDVQHRVDILFAIFRQ